MNGVRIEIDYCPECAFLLRAGWMAQELLRAFEAEVDEVALRPRAGGDFIVRIGDQELYSRKAAGRFADAKEIKELVREAIGSPQRFGHRPRQDPPR